MIEACRKTSVLFCVDVADNAKPAAVIEAVIDEAEPLLLFRKL
jgi:hypothetical protein